jgi:hypothetical protein
LQPCRNLCENVTRLPTRPDVRRPFLLLLLLLLLAGGRSCITANSSRQRSRCWLIASFK